MKKIDTRQSVNRAILQELFPWVGSQSLDVLMSSIDQDLIVPLKVDAQNPTSLTINIGPSVVANTVSGRNKALTFVNGIIPDITIATVTFPSISGGNITGSNTAVPVNLVLNPGEYVQVLLTIDDTSNISMIVGSPDPVEANLIVPPPIVNLLPFAYVTLFNNAGTIENVAQNKIYQIVGPEAPTTGGSTPGANGWIAKVVPQSTGATQYTVNLSTPMPDLSYTVFAMLENDTDTLPQIQDVEVVSKTLTSFSFEWNSPLDSSNYSLNYIIPPKSINTIEQSINSGVGSFSTPLPIFQGSSTYPILGVIQNLIDTYPQFKTAVVTSKNTTAFGTTMDGATDTANYILTYMTNPTAQFVVPSSATTVSLVLPVDYGSTDYAVVAVLGNVDDAIPQIQPLLVTAKTSSQFTASVNVATFTGNYVLTYYAIGVTT